MKFYATAHAQSSRHSVFHVNSAEGGAAGAASEAAGLARDQYLFDSADAVGFFLNPGAVSRGWWSH
jgi:hypothetical protein